MRIVLTGGCTGGHIYPALAIGDKVRAEDPAGEVIYIAKGEELERKIIPEHGYTLYEVDSTWFDRSNPVRLAVTVKRTLAGRRDAIRIMKKFRPDAVISTGSFVSVPVVLAARRLRVPVYLHEANGFPGISNRMAAANARRVFIGFEAARQYFDACRLPAEYLPKLRFAMDRPLEDTLLEAVADVRWRQTAATQLAATAGYRRGETLLRLPGIDL